MQQHQETQKKTILRRKGVVLNPPPKPTPEVLRFDYEAGLTEIKQREFTKQFINHRFTSASGKKLWLFPVNGSHSRG